MLNNLGLGLQLTMEENITSSADEVTQSFNDVQDSAQAMVDNVNQSMQTFQNIAVGGMALSQAGDRVMQFGNSITGAFFGAGQQIMGITSLFEKFRITLDTLFEDGNKALEWAIEMGKTTPFETKGLISGMLSMKGLGIDVREEFQGVNNEAQKLVSWIGDLAGLRPDRGLSGAIHAAQNFMMGRQRTMQLGYGMRVQEVLGEDIGDSVEERASQFVRMVSDRGATGLMSDLEGTWMQMMSNLVDYKDDFLRGIGEAGFFEDVKATVTNFIQALNDVDFKQTGKALTEVMETLYTPVDMLARGLTTLTAKFLEFAERYPAMTKLFGVIFGGIGITATLTGIIMKLSGGFMMAFASVGMLITQIQLLNVATSGATASITGMLSGLQALIGTLSVFAFGAGIAFYAWQRNLYGFQDAVNGLIDDIMDNDVFAKIQAFGKLLYNLFAEDTGSTVFFSDSLRAELESLGMWELAVKLTMLKGRFNALFEGIFEGFGGIIEFAGEVSEVVLAPIRYLNEEFDVFNGLLDSATEKDTSVYYDIGKALGVIGGVFASFKILAGLKTLGVIFGFIAKKALFATGAIKLLPFIGLGLVLNEFVDLGDLIETSFFKIGRAFETLQESVAPLWKIFKDFGENVPKLGIIDSLSVAVTDLQDWWNKKGQYEVYYLSFLIRDSFKQWFLSAEDYITTTVSDTFSSITDYIIKKADNFEFPNLLDSLDKGVELAYEVTGIDFSLGNIISSAIDIKTYLFNKIADAIGWTTDDGRAYDIARIATRVTIEAVEWLVGSIIDIGKSLFNMLFNDESDVNQSGSNLVMSIGKLSLEIVRFVFQLGAGVVAGITEAVIEDIDLAWDSIKQWAYDNLSPTALFEKVFGDLTDWRPELPDVIGAIFDWWEGNSVTTWTYNNVHPVDLFEDVFSGLTDWLPEMPDVIGKLGEWKDSIYDWFNKFEFPEFPSLSMPNIGGWFGNDDDDNADPKKPSAPKGGGYPESSSNSQSGDINTKGDVSVDSIDQSIHIDEVSITVPVSEGTNRQSARQQALMILEELKEISKDDNDRNYNIENLNGVASNL